MVVHPVLRPEPAGQPRRRTSRRRPGRGSTTAEPPVLTNRAISRDLPARLDVQAGRHRGGAGRAATPRTASSRPRRRSRCRARTPTLRELRRHRRAAPARPPRCATRWPRSCNTAFAELAASWARTSSATQADGVRHRRRTDLPIPLPVAPSTLGDIPDTAVAAAVRHRAAGRRAHAAAERDDRRRRSPTAAQVMAPHLVGKIQSPDLDVIDETKPDRLGQAMPRRRRPRR